MGDEKVDKTDIEAEENAGQPPEDVLTEVSPADSDPEEAAAVTETGELETRVAALTDQLLRAQAETENVRRRSARDVENAHKFALEKFASELLPVVDSLEKALEATESADGAPGEAIGEGVGLSLKLFLDVLEKAGISRIDPTGEPFDPQQHEAMAMVEHPDAEPNSVIEVMQKGYALNGRLIRAAMVVVSKAPG